MEMQSCFKSFTTCHLHENFKKKKSTFRTTFHRNFLLITCFSIFMPYSRVKVTFWKGDIQWLNCLKNFRTNRIISGHTGPTHWIFRNFNMHTGMTKIRIFLSLIFFLSSRIYEKECPKTLLMGWLPLAEFTQKVPRNWIKFWALSGLFTQQKVPRILKKCKQTRQGPEFERLPGHFLG